MPISVATKPAGFARCLSALTGLGDLPVWSLIVTVFGDLARAPGDRISGPLLSAVLDPIGIKPEASRVALHRLRKDGWIISERTGRTGLHQLTEFGRVQSTLASPQIYQMPDLETHWHLLITPNSAPCDASCIPVAPRVCLGNGPAPQDGDALVIAGDLENIPPWLQDQIETPDLVTGYTALQSALTQVHTRMTGRPDPLQTAILRTLIVHHWRRLVLRHPALPDSFHSDKWRGPDCRTLTFDLLQALPRPSLDVLEDSL